MVFLAILFSLRPDLVDLSQARNRSNLQNLEVAFGLAERELRIPRLLEPCGEWTTAGLRLLQVSPLRPDVKPPIP